MKTFFILFSSLLAAFLTTTLSAAPENDSFAGRFEITSLDYHFDGSILDATIEAGEPVPPTTARTVWWKFTPADAGVFTVWPSSNQFAAVVKLYEGSSLELLSAITPLNSNRFQLQAGREYALQIAAGEALGGSLSLDTHFFPKTNDYFEGSIHLEGTNITFVGNFTTATFEANEPNPGKTNTIWASWVAPFTGRTRITRLNTGVSQYVAVYTGYAVDKLRAVPLVNMVYSRVDFLAIQGTVYHIQMAGGSDECPLTIQHFPYGQATNDNFATARLVLGQWAVNSYEFQEWFPITQATSEPGESAHLGGTPYRSLWWKWVAPVHGLMTFAYFRSLTTNIVLGVYTGNDVAALTLVGRTNREVQFKTIAGTTYYIAAAVPTNIVGDVLLEGSCSSQSSESRIVPGNLLQEPSWEGTRIINAQYWRKSSGVSGMVNAGGGCDGSTWPRVGKDVQIWQDIPTTPGRKHSICFAMRSSNNYGPIGTGDGRVSVLWDNEEIGVVILPAAEAEFWHWAEFSAVANNPTSRIAFANLARSMELDAFSVVAAERPPGIVTQPVSLSIISGGTAAFVVGASGTLPLSYQWYFNGEPCAVLASSVLQLDAVSTNQAGTYQVVLSNAFGMVTSAPVTLTVEAPLTPVILWQPQGNLVGVGGYQGFSVVAAGTPPLNYQWLKDGNDLPGETNRTLTFSSVGDPEAGTYSVRVWNDAGSVWSLAVPLVVTNAINGGGKVNFRNRFVAGGIVNAPIFGVDGATLLSGSNYLAQLYGGASLELLRPVGAPMNFESGFNAGYFFAQIVVLPTVSPGSNAVLQIRVWDGNRGSTYEEAQAFGGSFGKSQVLTVKVGGGTTSPAYLLGLQSFSLQAGLPQFARGLISPVDHEPGGVAVWSHRGEPGFRYVIERSFQGFHWRPFLVITNVTSTETFTDSAGADSDVVFYRSRALD
jgi:hypothetical protein